MSKFFINRPIVAMVIAIFFVIAGAVMVFRLPVAQFPEIVPPKIQTTADLHRRGRAHRRTVGRHSDRGAGQRREEHDLHAVDQWRRRHDDAAGQLRGRHRRRS